jgi:hypothetical protein
MDLDIGIGLYFCVLTNIFLQFSLINANILYPINSFFTDILNTYLNNRLAPVQEVPESEELLKDIEFPMISEYSNSKYFETVFDSDDIMAHCVATSFSSLNEFDVSHP